MNFNQTIIDSFWSCLWEWITKSDFFEGNFVAEFDIDEYPVEVHGYCSANVCRTKATQDTPEWNDVKQDIELHSVIIYTEDNHFNFNIKLL